MHSSPSTFETPFFQRIIQQRFASPAGIALVSLLIGFYALLSAKKGVTGAILLPAVFIGGPVFFTTAFSQKLGLYLALGIAYFLGPVFMAAPGVPVGLAQDFLIVFVLAGLLVKSYRTRDWSAFSTPVNVALFLWIANNLLQVANPAAPSRVAWFYVMRPAVVYILLFFIALSVLKTRRDVIRLLSVLLGLGAVSGLWGVYQFWAGYFSFEMNFILRSDAVHLVFNDGRWRSFGTMVSPSQFGMTMAYLMVVTAALLLSRKKFIHKVLFGIVLLLLAAGMIYSGTRTSYAMLPIAMVSAVVISGNRRMMLGGAVGALLFFGLIHLPTSNYQLMRFQSAFKKSDDASFNVRAENRKRITPFILSHPFGGGMGTTGVWGMRFSPGTMLSGFAPDSGLYRIAVEMGWVGLLFYLFFWANLLIHGYLGVRKIHDPELKTIALGILSALPAMLLAEYAQDLMNKMPSSLLFWLIIASLFALIRIGSQPAQTETAPALTGIKS